MNILDQRKSYFGEAKRCAEQCNREIAKLGDKQSTAKQRRSLTQATLVINKTMRHVGNIMGL